MGVIEIVLILMACDRGTRGSLLSRCGEDGHVTAEAHFVINCLFSGFIGVLSSGTRISGIRLGMDEIIR